MALPLLLLLLVWTGASPSWACPQRCRCSLDERGRRGVRCEAGGMLDLPVSEMGSNTEVLVVSAPPAAPNRLTLGPIFKGLRNLEEVHITHSKIPALGAHSFWGLQRLHTINLTHNYISVLMATNFRGADVLHHLDLSHNRIQSVPSAVFRHVSHLRSLSLAHNEVPELMPRIFFGLTRLERLDLSHNPLKDLQPEQFSDVPDLHHLYCAGCQLSSVSSTLLQMLPQLRDLDLRDNRLTQVPSGVSTNALPHLVTLWLDGNQLSFIERGAISGSPLVSLHLAHNRISRLEPQAFANSSVKHLDISYNHLSHVEPSALDDTLHKLHDLQLSGNSLSVQQLLVVLPKARQLRHLGLGELGLTRFPADLLRHARHLHHLNISANYLTTFSTGVFFNAPHLRSLDLSQNKFRGLDYTFFEAVSLAMELRTLRLEGNPWQCDQCHLGPLLRWLQDAPDQESGCSEPRVWTCLTCQGPKGVVGLQLAMLPAGDLPPCPFTTTPAMPVKPSWLEPSFSAVTEEPELPRGQLTRQEDAESSWAINSLVEEEVYLLIVAGCVLLLLLLVLVVVGIILYNRHSAFYYTYEEDPEKKEKLMKAKESSKNNNGTAKPPTNIATIDEMTDIDGSHEMLEKEPELNDTTRDHHNHVPNHLPLPTPAPNHTSATSLNSHNHISTSPSSHHNGTTPSNHSSATSPSNGLVGPDLNNPPLHPQPPTNNLELNHKPPPPPPPPRTLKHNTQAVPDRSSSPTL